MSIGERLKTLIGILGLTQREFAERVGVSKSLISEYVHGKRIPPKKTLALISKTFNVSMRWLAEGEGEMFLPKESVEELEFIAVPIITSVGAGGNIYTSDYELIQRSKLPHARVKAFRVDGDSMEPTIQKGELVIIDEEDKELRDGGIYLIAEPENGLRIRRLRRLNDEWWLFADNPAYAPERLKEGCIIGRVKYKFKPAQVEGIK
ncbi:MAG: XRE family transcriptional regulator [Hydrogenobacter thermophilus]|uniref:XRE family transcriptional regulator n=1 Tax=Hydrogenobacter thermophilus TaxID=940 RepID=UPI001C764558|nr:XRE family transcriptional regulator [Hydrogenobacter thermophilus]QWK19738.1 MAG: XRE family transcriptional regulator [Hydrogenobacter thermophilus]